MQGGEEGEEGGGKLGEDRGSGREGESSKICPGSGGYNRLREHETVYLTQDSYRNYSIGCGGRVDIEHTIVKVCVIFIDKHYNAALFIRKDQ